jgi:hypothetical protein
MNTTDKVNETMKVVDIYEHALIKFNNGDTMHYSIAKALIFLEVDSLNFKQYNIILDMLKDSDSESLSEPELPAEYYYY